MTRQKEFSLLMRYISETNEWKPPLSLYERFLAKNPFSEITHSPFSKKLARMAFKNTFTLSLVDVWTRLFDPKNEARFKLNAVIALYECSPQFSQNLQRDDSNTLLNRLQILGTALRYVGTLFLASFCIGGIYTAYLVRRR